MTDSKPFRPMLAYDGSIQLFEKLLKQHGNLFASYKLDGIRATVLEGKLTSRSGKYIKSKQCQQLFGIPALEGMDGELIVGKPTGNDVFKRCYSGVMTSDANVNVWFHIFDKVMPTIPFFIRNERVEDICATPAVLRDTSMRVIAVKQVRIETIEALIDMESSAIEKGYEGLIVRTPSAPYKHGRSTEKEGGMGKLKRWEDSEGTVLDFEEMLHNANEATIDARGYQVRSSHKEHKYGMDMMGKVTIKDVKHGWEVKVGSGFSHEERKHIWMNPQLYKGRLMRYKFLPHGTHDAARHPVFAGWRDPDDMSLPTDT